MAAMGSVFGRDRRRRLSAAEAGALFSIAQGRCQRCGVALGVDWHQAHMVAYSHGGATTVDQMQAWCRDCNLAQGNVDATDVGLPSLRTWQVQAMDNVLAGLWQTGTATVHAAPGAGKTFFAGVVFHHLKKAGLVDRMVVVVPNRALLRQWTEAMGKIQIHLDYDPRDGFYEHPETVGSVVTYQGLASSASGQIQRMDWGSTLLVLDEVHHVGDQAAWGQAVSRIVGSAKSEEGFQHCSVLNMTGTLFRSRGDQKIGTVRYSTIMVEGEEKLEATADFSVWASDLIGVELRRPDLYAYDGQVKLVDVRDETELSSQFADLQPGSQVNTAIRSSFKKRVFVHEFAKEAFALLQQQLATIQDREPLKLLWVADDQASAKMAAEEINKVVGRDFARLVISEEKEVALTTLRHAASDSHSCAIVAVRMVTEGFDCAHVSVIAYASATSAVLFLAQTMARAMRVTQTERADRAMLPAQILIPNNPSLRAAFADALVGHFHILDVPDEKTIAAAADGGNGFSGVLRMPRYELVDVSTLNLHSATVLGMEDGTVLAADLSAALAVCLELSIPEVYAPRVAVASRRIQPTLPLYTKRANNSDPEGPQTRDADPRTLNLARRARVKVLANWMNHHVEHDDRFASIGVFQVQANKSAGLKAVGGRNSATSEQLESVENWMLVREQEHCATHGCALPNMPDRETS